MTDPDTLGRLLSLPGEPWVALPLVLAAAVLFRRRGGGGPAGLLLSVLLCVGLVAGLKLSNYVLAPAACGKPGGWFSISGHAALAAVSYAGIALAAGGACLSAPRRVQALRAACCLAIGSVVAGRLVVGAHGGAEALAGTGLGLALAIGGPGLARTAGPALPRAAWAGFLVLGAAWCGFLALGGRTEHLIRDTGSHLAAPDCR